MQCDVLECDGPRLVQTAHRHAPRGAEERRIAAHALGGGGKWVAEQQHERSRHTDLAAVDVAQGCAVVFQT